MHPDSAVDTESVTLPPAPSSLHLTPAESIPSKNSRPSSHRAPSPSQLTASGPTPEQASWEQEAVTLDTLVASKDSVVSFDNNSYNNALPIGQAGKLSRLRDYLSVNPEDPWNQEWVVYAARTPLPGESSFSLQTGEAATTSRRRRYNTRRRAEVAFTRINGGACEGCRRRRRAVSNISCPNPPEILLKQELQCPHRLQELGAVIDGDGAPSEQFLEVEGGVTQPATNTTHSDLAAGIGPTTRDDGAIVPESSATGMLFASILPQGRSQESLGHGGTSAGPSSDLGWPSSPRLQASLTSPGLDNNPEIGRAQSHTHDDSNILRLRPARHSVRRGEGIAIVGESGGRSRQLNNMAMHETRQDFAASRFVQGLHSLHSTERESGELPSMHDVAGSWFYPPTPHEQQSLSSEQRFTVHPGRFDATPHQRTISPHEILSSEFAEGSYANLGRAQASSPNPFETIPARDLDESNGPDFTHSETHCWPSQQTNLDQDYFDEQVIGFTSPTRDSSLLRNRSDEQYTINPDIEPDRLFTEAFTWNIEDRSWFNVDPSEEIFDAYSRDGLCTGSWHRDDRQCTQPPVATEEPPQSAGPTELDDVDLLSGFLLDDTQHIRDDTNDPPFESYLAYLGNPDFVLPQDSASGSNSDLILTPPSDDTQGPSHEA